MRLVEMMPDDAPRVIGYLARLVTKPSRGARLVVSMGGLPPNHCMQPTPQPVIKFAYANLPPVWCAADAGC